MNQRKQIQQEQDMRPTAWRNGQPVKYEVAIVDEPAHLPTVVDNAPIIAPVQPDRMPRTQYVITGTPEEEARAFNVRTNNLALVLSGGGVLLALVFGASLTAFTGIMLQAGLYAATWLVAYLVDVLRSPGGIELHNSWQLWRYLRREQEYRHGKAPWDPIDVVMVALIAGAMVLVVAGGIALLAMEFMPR